MTPTPPPTIWAERILETQKAIHALLTGTRVVVLESPDGTRVEYQETEIDKLWTYLAYLQGEAKEEATGVKVPRLGPVYITP